MNTLEHIQQLIAEIGPATPEIGAVHQEDESAWLIFFDEQTAIGLDYVADQEKLVLSTELGSPPEEHRAATHEFLLIFNYSWEQSGGVKMALDGPGGEVVMIFELNAANLSLQMLQNILVNFASRVEVWRQLVAAGLGGAAAEAATSAQGEQEATGMLGGIRV